MIVSGQGWPAFPMPIHWITDTTIRPAMGQTLSEVVVVSITKPCVRCGEVNRSTKDHSCIPCRLMRAKEYRERNKDAIKRRLREWYLKADKYALAKKKVEYNKRNAEKLAAAKLLWQRKNRDKCRASGKKHYENNKEKYRETRRLYELEKRARIKSSGGKLSKGIAEKLFVLQKGCCAICSVKLQHYHLDHIMPIALGGGNTDENIQLLCPHCNLTKNAKHPIDYMQSIGKLL